MSWGSIVKEEAPVEELFKAARLSSSSLSVEPPMEEWSSLLIPIETTPNLKVIQYKQGLYSPGSEEICTKYVAMSDSSVLRHPYYVYPSVKDPGIEEALLMPEPQKEYGSDGQDLYLDLCKETGIAVNTRFHRELLEETIDLKYYGVNPVGVRAMCLALQHNPYVKRLDLATNFLSDDACYHLGRLLAESSTLKELVLSGCRIGARGVESLLASLPNNAIIELLDLSKNQIGDEGFEYLADVIMMKRAVIKRLNLSRNDLGTKSALRLAQVLEYNNTIAELDLSWNQLFMPRGLIPLLERLGESQVLTDLNLSWNSLVVSAAPRSSNALAGLFLVPTLQFLDLSNNRLSSDAALAIANSLKKAKHLKTLNLSDNPLKPADALRLLKKMKFRVIKLQNLLMDEVPITKMFEEELKVVMSRAHRAHSTITHGRLIRDMTVPLPDMRDIVMKRLVYLASTMKKKVRIDILVYLLEKRELTEMLAPREMLQDMRQATAPIGEPLILELGRAFPGPPLDKKIRLINLERVVDYIKRLWPEAKIPPPVEHHHHPHHVKVKKGAEKKKK